MVNIPNKIIRDQGLSDLDVTVWAFIKIVASNGNVDKNLISASSIIYQMYGKLTVNHGIKDAVSQSISYLLNCGALLGEKIGKDSYIINIDMFREPDKFFSQINASDLRRIMQLPNHPAAVLRQYLYIISTINLDTKCGIWSIPQLADDLNKGEKTIMRYNQELEDLKLLYIYHSGDWHTTNTYGRYEDRQIIENFGDSRTGGTKRKDTANRKRKMTQIYNQVLKGKHYDEETMQKLQKFCEEQNALIRTGKIIDKNLYILP